MRTKTKFSVSPGTAAMVICPPGAESDPVLTVIPPIKFRDWRSPTARFPALNTTPGCDVADVAKIKLLGLPTRA